MAWIRKNGSNRLETIGESRSGLGPGGEKFEPIDAKLGLAMGTVVTDAKDDGSAVNMRLGTRTGQVGKNVELIKGREVLSLIIKNFRAASHVEILFNAQHTSDRNLAQFFHPLQEVLSNMKPGDAPNESTLRGSLYRKIKNSNLVAFDIRAYESMVEGDPGKTCDYLRKMTKKFIEKQREDKMIT